MKTSTPFIVASLLLLFLGTGCYPDKINDIEELDTVLTEFDGGFFPNNTASTFILPDSILPIGSSNSLGLTPSETDFILSRVRNNLLDYGWTEITEIENDNIPDVSMIVSAISTEVLVGDCIPYYPCWGWCWPGWGWGPGFCYPVYYRGYDIGTLTIDMIDNDASANREEFVRVWHTGINGLLRSSQAGNAQFIERTIDQGFTQSPYLERN